MGKNIFNIYTRYITGENYNVTDLSRVNYTLSNINALLGSTVGALDDKSKGASSGEALFNFGNNVLNGAIRNEVAYDMRKTTGSNLGFLINGMAGYGNDEANAKGMQGLFGATLLTSMLGGGCYGGGWFGGGMYPMMGPFGGGMFGGGCCGMPPMSTGGFFPSSMSFTEINISHSGRRFGGRHFWC